MSTASRVPLPTPQLLHIVFFFSHPKCLPVEKKFGSRQPKTNLIGHATLRAPMSLSAPLSRNSKENQRKPFCSSALRKLGCVCAALPWHNSLPIEWIGQKKITNCFCITKRSLPRKVFNTFFWLAKGLNCFGRRCQRPPPRRRYRNRAVKSQA